jgi:hypothetical protein
MEHRELTYLECRPHSELQGWIQSLWTFDAAALTAPVYEHFVPPDGCISILSKRQADISASRALRLCARQVSHAKSQSSPRVVLFKKMSQIFKTISLRSAKMKLCSSQREHPAPVIGGWKPPLRV